MNSRWWIFIALSFWCLQAGLHTVGNSDLFWQLKTGELILSGNFPKTDLFTYSVYSTPWVNHEWLACILFDAVYHWGGYEGLSVLLLLLNAGITGLLFRIFNKQNTWMAVLGTITILYLSGMRLEILRPDLFGYLFFLLFFTLLLSPSRWRWPGLLVSQILWVNLHASSLLGLVLVGLWALRVGLEKKTTRPFLWLIPLALSLVINPYGVRLFSFTLTHLTAPITTATVSDWIPLLNQGQMVYFYFWIFFLLLLGTLMVAFKNRSQFDIIFSLFTLAFILMTFKHQRFLFYSSFLLMFWILNHLKNVNVSKWIKISILLTPLLGMYSGPVNGIRITQDPTKIDLLLGKPLGLGLDAEFPLDAVGFLKKNPPRGRIFNDMEYGSFYTFYLWPEKIFIDTRTPIYGEYFLYAYIHAPENPVTLENFWNLSNVSTLVFSKDYLKGYPNFQDWLQQSKIWKSVFESQLVVIYNRSAPLSH